MRAGPASPPVGRELLNAATRTWFRAEQKVPADFEEARSDILPVMRRRGTYECALLEQQGGGMTAIPAAVHAEDFAVEVAYDWPECLTHLGGEVFCNWGVGLGDALKVAIENLRQISREGLQAADPGFWISPWHDNYDACRILLPELIERCEVKGSHVAMVPHQNLLLVTGSEDADGLERMASLAEEVSSGSGCLSGIPLLLVGDGWSPLELPRSHPLARRYRFLRQITMASDYSRQGELLTALHALQGKGIFAAKPLIRHDFGWTISSWASGVDTLLPETQYVGFSELSPDGKALNMLAAGEWGRVREVVGDIMEPLGLYPERYRVRSFPAPEQLEAIRGDGPDLRIVLRQGRSV